MKKFVVKVLVFVLIVSGFVFVANNRYIKNDQSDAKFIQKFENVPYGIQICNLGSSHGLFGFNYDELSSNYVCFNFGLLSQSLTYDYILLQNYKEHLDEYAIVFIPVSFCIINRIDETEMDDFKSKNSRYYSFLPREDIKEYSYSEKFYSMFPSLCSRDGLMYVLTHQMEKWNYWESSAEYIDIEADAERVYREHFVEYRVTDSLFNQNEVNAVYDIIELCKENNFIPVLITTPLLTEYTQSIQKHEPDYLESYSRLIKEIADSTNCAYYDYSKDSRMVHNKSLFIDADHLNYFGARDFVYYLTHEVSDLYYLVQPENW